MTDPLDDTPPQKDLGPQATLLKRRIWGAVCVAALLGFLSIVVTISGRGSRCVACAAFGADGAVEAPPTWLLIPGAVAAVGLSLRARPRAGRAPARVRRRGLGPAG